MAGFFVPLGTTSNRLKVQLVTAFEQGLVPLSLFRPILTEKPKTALNRLNDILTDKRRVNSLTEFNELPLFKLKVKSHKRKFGAVPMEQYGYEQHQFKPIHQVEDIEVFQKQVEGEIHKFLLLQFRAKGSIKVWAGISIDGIFHGEYTRPFQASVKNQKIIHESDIRGVIDTFFINFLEKLEGTAYFNAERVLQLDMSVAMFKDRAGGSYIESPKWIQNKKAVINVRNEDDRCLEWALLSALYPVDKKADRCSLYRQHVGILNFEGIDFPVRVEDLRVFERQNPAVRPINAYMLVKAEERGIRRCYASQKTGPDPINLLILSKDGRYHWTWIKDWKRLTNKQGQRHHVCDICCGRSFVSQENLDKHKINCAKGDQCYVVMPDDTHVEFANPERTLEVPVVCYADFEALCPTITNEFVRQKHKAPPQVACAYSIRLHYTAGHQSMPVMSILSLSALLYMYEEVEACCNAALGMQSK